MRWRLRPTADIEELLVTTALAPLDTVLQLLRGVATISSVKIAAEIGEPRLTRR
ncbi:MAG: hypothetical protein KDA86_03695 [Planctomycetaceae bacterium]|nr:hypothetical protein [Planctomycetaceae bacterium]